MRLSCSDYTWPTLGHATVMAVVADLGFEALDIGVFSDNTHTKMSDMCADPLAEAARLSPMLERAGLGVADVFLIPAGFEEFSPNNPDPADQAASLEIFGSLVVFARELGAPGVTLLPGVRFEGDSPTAAIDRAAQGLARRIEIAASQGLRVGVEGHSGSCVDTPERFAELLDKTPGLWATLDPAHYAYEGFDAASVVGLVPRTRHVQIRPSGPGLMQGRLPDNTFDLAALIQALADDGYPGYVATEFVWIESWDCDRVDNTAETHRLKHYLAELGQRSGL